MKEFKMPDYNEWRKNQYALFNTKIDHFKDHPKYSWLRQYADEALRWNENFGYRYLEQTEEV